MFPWRRIYAAFAAEIRPVCLSKENYHNAAAAHHPLILPRIIQFLKDVTPLERMRRINGVLEALSGR